MPGFDDTARGAATHARRPSSAVWLLLVLLLLSACASAPTAPPRSEPPSARASRTPLVLVPGITGTALRDRATGSVVWGKGMSIFLPRDGGYAMARSVHLEPGDTDRLEPGSVIESLEIGLISRPVYGPIPDRLVDDGYVRGDLAAPRPEDTLFLFGYDWRDDNSVTAARLFEQLETLRLARGEDQLVVDLLCQSNGAHVCRWLLKYGAASLERAERGEGGLPETLRVRRLILAGTANGGALRMLREVDRGRLYAPYIGRAMRPETLFGFPAFYQDLPVTSDDLFIDLDGERVDLDLFDADVWVDQGWAVFADDARQRIARAERPDLFGTEDDRRRHLERSLDRARRFHALLRRDAPGFDLTELHSIQSIYRPTPRRAVVASSPGGGTALWFTGDPQLATHPYAEALATAPGDGHATARSQTFLSPQEQAVMVDEPFFVNDDHFALIVHPASLRRLLEILSP